MPWDGLLAMTMMVCDEAEILPVNLDYHLAQGVDLIFVLDHGSTDATPEILAEYAAAGGVRSVRDDEPGYSQAKRITRLLASAAEAGADWVLHGDADEFWVPTAGSLRDVFAAVPDRYGYLVVPRHDFPPLSDESAAFHERLIARPAQSLNDAGHPLEPKVAQRPAAATAVAAGNHSLIDPRTPPAPDIGAVEILHFPLRTYAQFEHKVVRNGEAHERDALGVPGVGWVAKERLGAYRRGQLPDYWHQRLLDPQEVPRKVGAGELVIDRRLHELLTADPTPARESPRVRAVLTAAWGRHADVTEALVQAEANGRDLSAALDAERQARRADRDAANAEIASLHDQLQTVRDSRIMRSTRNVRRAYYRLRSRAGGRG